MVIYGRGLYQIVVHFSISAQELFLGIKSVKKKKFGRLVELLLYVVFDRLTRVLLPKIFWRLLAVFLWYSGSAHFPYF